MDNNRADVISSGTLPAPGYADLIIRGYNVVRGAVRDCTNCGLELSKSTFHNNAYLTWREVGIVCLCAVLWTISRRKLATCLLQPVAQWCHLKPKDAVKMPESAWKFIFYSASWSYSAYLLFLTEYTFFQDPSSVFHDWTSGMPIPIDITIAYLIQGSFYGHSIYASFYMDVWRRDSVIMVIHHVVTLVLITFSYAFRYHKIGVLVLFLHDINDIQLEFTKLNVYLRNSGWVYKSINEIISTVGCISFSFTWFWFRLYWFPLKVLYASCIASLESVPNIPFYFLFNSLLFTLLLMNLYWFLYIMLFMVKVLTGQMKEIKDVREYEDEEHEKAKLLNIAENDTDHPDLRQEEGHEKNGIPKEKSL
ncbi:hypothetical protein AALO_G00004490 [Alosa alosa]|uniref:TLC domain-containing protein n=1 Tax=Alosa alosa TaxID=278164 RepID=A0AAV6HJ05_9TELE|nr:ceramide synthase 1-like isoform X1 [Alosa alosa]KAG5285536.1 hypothetical protein AALO_G00004490 [Alosa alosa]